MSAPPNVRLGGLFSLVRSTANGEAIIDRSGIRRLHAFLMAIDEINGRTDILPRTNLSFAIKNTRGDIFSALLATLEMIGTCAKYQGDSQHQNTIAIVGADSSAATQSVAQALSRIRIPQISYASTSAALSSGRDFPYLLRTPPSDTFQAVALADMLVSKWRFRAVATVSSTDSYGTQGMAEFLAQAALRNLTILTSQSISADADFTVVYRPHTHPPSPAWLDLT
jgi:hypothetical protein